MLHRLLKRLRRNKETREKYTYLTQEVIPGYKMQLKDANRNIEEIKAINRKQRVQLEKLPVLEKQLIELASLVDAKYIEESPHGCTKEKCSTKQEALEFARKVRARTGQQFTTYECEICPRSKRTGKKWWHITHKEKYLRGLYGKPNVQ